MNAIEVKELTKSYPSFKLDGISFTLPCGCILGLIGENGAGKSTTIKLILDEIAADGGTVKILGKDSSKNITLLKEDIGVVPDEIGLPELLNAVQIGKIMKRTFKNWNDDDWEYYLKKLSVPKNKPFRSFSRGTKMKLGIAIAMSHGSKLLIFDEATNGLDPVVRDDVVEMLYEFTRSDEHSVLISSHIVSDLERLCDYVAFLHKGKLILFEEKDILQNEYRAVSCTEAEFSQIDTNSVLRKTSSPYGVRAIVRKDSVPAEMNAYPVSLEELFVQTVKENV